MKVCQVLVSVLMIIKASSAVPEPQLGSLLTGLLGAPATPPTTPPPTINPSTTGTAGATAFSTGAGIVPAASSLLNGLLGVGGTLGGTVSGLAPGLGGLGDILNLVAGNTGVAQQLVTLLFGNLGAVCSNGTLTTPSMLPGLQGLLGLLTDSFSALFNGIQQIINSLLDLFANNISIFGDNCCNSGLASGIGNAFDDLRDIMRGTVGTTFSKYLNSLIKMMLSPSCTLSKLPVIANALTSLGGVLVPGTLNPAVGKQLTKNVQAFFNAMYSVAGSPPQCSIANQTAGLASNLPASTVQNTALIAAFLCCVQVRFSTSMSPAAVVANMNNIIDLAYYVSEIGLQLTNETPTLAGNWTSAVENVFGCFF